MPQSWQCIACHAVIDYDDYDRARTEKAFPCRTRGIQLVVDRKADQLVLAEKPAENSKPRRALSLQRIPPSLAFGGCSLRDSGSRSFLGIVETVSKVAPTARVIRVRRLSAAAESMHVETARLVESLSHEPRYARSTVSLKHKPHKPSVSRG
jgi:hypothetical protein